MRPKAAMGREYDFSKNVREGRFGSEERRIVSKQASRRS
jgi:hypothetical protein